MKLKEGVKIRFLVPLYSNTVFSQKETPVGAIGEIGSQFHDRSPLVPVWFGDGSWVDLEEFTPDQYEIVP